MDLNRYYSSGDNYKEIYRFEWLNRRSTRTKTADVVIELFYDSLRYHPNDMLDCDRTFQMLYSFPQLWWLTKYVVWRYCEEYTTQSQPSRFITEYYFKRFYWHGFLLSHLLDDPIGVIYYVRTNHHVTGTAKNNCGYIWDAYIYELIDVMKKMTHDHHKLLCNNINNMPLAVLYEINERDSTDAAHNNRIVQVVDTVASKGSIQSYVIKISEEFDNKKILLNNTDNLTTLSNINHNITDPIWRRAIQTASDSPRTFVASYHTHLKNNRDNIQYHDFAHMLCSAIYYAHAATIEYCAARYTYKLSMSDLIYAAKYVIFNNMFRYLSHYYCTIGISNERQLELYITEATYHDFVRLCKDIDSIHVKGYTHTPNKYFDSSFESGVMCRMMGIKHNYNMSNSNKMEIIRNKLHNYRFILNNPIGIALILQPKLYNKYIFLLTEHMYDDPFCSDLSVIINDFKESLNIKLNDWYNGLYDIPAPNIDNVGFVIQPNGESRTIRSRNHDDNIDTGADYNIDIDTVAAQVYETRFHSPMDQL